MKKIKCFLKHPLWLIRIKDTITEDYENEFEEVRAYKCNECDTIVYAYVRGVKGKFKIQ